MKSNRYYEIYATPNFARVTCPKHHKFMPELRNGLLGEQLWWCEDCEKPYYLKPTALRKGQFDRVKFDDQIREMTKK